jgi:hypothetical protein
MLQGYYLMKKKGLQVDALESLINQIKWHLTHCTMFHLPRMRYQ